MPLCDFGFRRGMVEVSFEDLEVLSDYLEDGKIIPAKLYLRNLIKELNK
jgi:hypothetical protein